MDHTTPLKKDCSSLEDGEILRGTIEPFEPSRRPGDLIALRLRQADGTRVEILTDAVSTVTQLVAEFGSLYASEGQQIEFSMSLLCTPRVRALRHIDSKADGRNGAESPEPAEQSDPDLDS